MLSFKLNLRIIVFTLFILVQGLISIFTHTAAHTDTVRHDLFAELVRVFDFGFAGDKGMILNSVFIVFLIAGLLVYITNPVKINLLGFSFACIFIQNIWELFFYPLMFVIRPGYYGFHVLQIITLMAYSLMLVLTSAKMIQELIALRKPEIVNIRYGSHFVPTTLEADKYQRICHLVIDTLIAFTLSIPLMLDGLQAIQKQSVSIAGVPLLYFIFPVFRFSYYFLLEDRFGITPAKFFCNTAVLHASDGPAERTDIFKRSLVRMIPLNALSHLGFGSWHDRWSQTRVVQVTGIRAEKIPNEGQTDSDRPEFYAHATTAELPPQKPTFLPEEVELIQLTLTINNEQAVMIKLYRDGTVARSGAGGIPAVQTYGLSRLADNSYFMQVLNKVSAPFLNHSFEHEEETSETFTEYKAEFFGKSEDSGGDLPLLWGRYNCLRCRLNQGSSFDHIALRITELYIKEAFELTNSWYFDILIVAVFGMRRKGMPAQTIFSFPEQKQGAREELNRYLVQLITSNGKWSLSDFYEDKIYEKDQREFKMVMNNIGGIPEIDFLEIREKE